MWKLALALVFAVVVGVSVPAAARAAPTATCMPQDCAVWQQGPVTFTWTDPDIAGNPALCPSSWDTESPDVNGTVVPCNDGASDGDGSVTVFIDKTPPFGIQGSADRPPDQNGWYNHPFSLLFSASGDNLSGPGPCDAIPYSGPDGAGLTVPGGCSDVAGNRGIAQSSPFNYDATLPQVTGAAADRPPDHNGWYNHPVTFSFRGTDATSGVAGCSTASYSGPVDSSAAVNGACTDNAGNIGLGHQGFKYDDARPSAASVQVTPGNHRVDVSWTLPGDATSVTVSRSRQGSTSAPKVVYSGTRRSVLDKGLHNGSKYRYSVEDMDQAGNTNVKVVRAIPTASSLRPYVGSVVNSPPLLTWKKIKRASYYNVQLWFGRKKVLSTWPSTPSLQLKHSWHFRGKTYTLAPGHYRWYVWPGFGPLSAHSYGKLIGRSSFRAVG
jgi:hypothetical protein